MHQKTPFEAGMFMLPVMVASGFGGPIAGMLVSKLGLREVATGGMLLSAFSFLGLALTDFSTQQWLAWGLMTLLSLRRQRAAGLQLRHLAAAPKEKAAAAARAIETMAYELGAGLGIALFGLILTRSYSATVIATVGLNETMAQRASSSIEAVQPDGATRRGGGGADGGGEGGLYPGAQSGAGDSRGHASAAGRRDLAQPRHGDEAADGAIAVATGPSPRGGSGARAFSFNAAALTVAAGTPTFQRGHHLAMTRQHRHRQQAQAHLYLPVGEA